MNAQCPHKRWSTLKSAVSGSKSDSSLLLLLGGGVVWSVSRSGRHRSAVHALAIRLPVLYQFLCLQVTGGDAAFVGSGFLWWH